MFFGSYYHQLDDKGRLRLPAKLRNELGGSYYCLKGFDGAIMIYPKEKFQEICEIYKSTPLTNVSQQRVLTEIMSSTHEAEEDAQGRFTLPAYLKQYAKIEKNVVIKGVFDKIEIWSQEAHENREINKSLNELVADLDAEVTK